MGLFQSLGLLLRGAAGAAKTLLIEVPVGAALLGACITSYMLMQASPAEAQDPSPQQSTGGEPTAESNSQTSSDVQTAAAEPEATIVQFAKYIGNTMTQKFHRPKCWFASKMWKKNKRRFAFRKDAIAAGYRPCQYCLPQVWLECQAAIKQATQNINDSLDELLKDSGSHSDNSSPNQSTNRSNQSDSTEAEQDQSQPAKKDGKRRKEKE